MTDTATQMTALTIPFERAIRGINAVLPHTVDKNDPAEPLKGIQVSPTMFVATNRMTVATYRHGADIAAGAEPIVIPGDAAAMLAKVTMRSLDRAKELSKYLAVTFTADAASIHFRDDEEDQVARFPYTQPKGSYPPVARLLDTWKPAEAIYPLAFNPELMAIFTTSAKKLGVGVPGPAESMLLELSEVVGYHEKVAGPVRISIGDDFTGLMQPLKRLVA